MEKGAVISELTQGRELAKQLRRQFDWLTLPQKNDLLQKLLSCYDKTLTALNWEALLGADRDTSKNDQCHRKRKTRGEQQIVGTDDDDDGYSWRKYGQKQILGANHPRAYYRCSHRNTQGCLATKQVQRSDEEEPSSVLVVTYKGKHSCSNSNQFGSQHQKLQILDATQHQKLLLPSQSPFFIMSSPTSSQSSMYLSSLLAQNDDYTQFSLNTQAPHITQQQLTDSDSDSDSPSFTHHYNPSQF